MIKKLFEKITGIKLASTIAADAVLAKEEIDAAANAIIATEAVRVANLSPKEKATEAKEPWVAVLDTHVDKNNIRNGFFELDWNEYFIVQLTNAGYQGETDEAIVDGWFGELCKNIGSDSGIDMEHRGSGFINVNNLGNGLTEAS